MKARCHVLAQRRASVVEGSVKYLLYMFLKSVRARRLVLVRSKTLMRRGLTRRRGAMCWRSLRGLVVFYVFVIL